jgi:hypothetical protein
MADASIDEGQLGKPYGCRHHALLREGQTSSQLPAAVPIDRSWQASTSPSSRSPESTRIRNLSHVEIEYTASGTTRSLGRLQHRDDGRGGGRRGTCPADLCSWPRSAPRRVTSDAETGSPEMSRVTLQAPV